MWISVGVLCVTCGSRVLNDAFPAIMRSVTNSLTAISNRGHSMCPFARRNGMPRFSGEWAWRNLRSLCISFSRLACFYTATSVLFLPEGIRSIFTIRFFGATKVAKSVLCIFIFLKQTPVGLVMHPFRFFGERLGRAN